MKILGAIDYKYAGAGLTVAAKCLIGLITTGVHADRIASLGGRRVAGIYCWWDHTGFALPTGY
jgi:hypothetical protein